MTPSPGPPRLVKAAVVAYPLPQGGDGCKFSPRLVSLQWLAWLAHAFQVAGSDSILIKIPPTTERA